MHIEIAQAVDFLGRLLQSKIDSDQLVCFKDKLEATLKDRFHNHWHVQNPNQGNGYRSISNFNGQLDPLLTRAAEKANVEPAAIHAHLPKDFVLWIDPFSVSYRVGDHGNIMTLFEDRSRGRITFKVDPDTVHKSPLLSPHLVPPSRASSAVRISPPTSPRATPKLSANGNHQSSPLANQLSVAAADQQPQTASSPSSPPDSDGQQKHWVATN